MKMLQKSLVILFVVFTFLAGSQVKAQSNWEIGARFGEINFAFDATIPLAAAPRLHPAVYVTDRFGVGGYFDWMFALSGGPTGLKFYPGVGPTLWFENDFDFDISGDFGAEYSFKFPLTVGFDWRPGFRVSNKFKWLSSNWGITARFRLGKSPKFEKAN